MSLLPLLVLVILAMTLEAAPLGVNDTQEFLEIVEQIRKVQSQVSASPAAAKVDVYDHLVSSVPEKSRLKVSRRILRKLLHIRDKTMMLRYKCHIFTK